MTNTEKIMRNMRGKGIDYVALSKKTKLPADKLCLQINNVKPMDLDTADAIAKALGIEDHEFGGYFFYSMAG